MLEARIPCWREKLEIVHVNINANRRSASWQSLGRRGRGRVVPVSSQVDEPHHAEPSFRTRPLIYDMMAAYGAAKSKTSRVLVPENGQDLPREIAAYRDVALNSARSMQRLADLADTPAAARVWAEIDGLARYQARSVQEVKDDMFALLQQHRSEWNAFLHHCGQSSWVTQLARG